ncbi:MAG: Rpn family recombination-promoting nuclease/putative transposase [bacterium]
MQFADPRTDFVFKRVFGNEKAKEVLISFLNAVIGLEGPRAIASVHILEPYQAPRIPSLKHSFLDVKCRDNRGVEFVVEMQIQYVEGLEKRIQFNACKAYVSQLASGEDYPKLNQVIGITVLDFVMFRDFPHYLSCHEFKEKVTGNCYLDEIRHYFIELPKFTKTANELETPIEKWCYFLKHTGKLQVIPDKLNSAPYLKAFELASRANMTKEEWEAFDATAVWIQDQRGAASAARKEGLQEGRQEGLQEGRREVARALRQEKVDPLIISKTTGLSIEEIEAL